MWIETSTMTDHEWTDCNDPTLMLCFISDKANERKMRLHKLACCRRVSAVADAPLLKTFEAIELYADGKSTKAALERARQAIRAVRYALPADDPLSHAAWSAYWLAEVAASERAYSGVGNEFERLVQEGLIKLSCDALKLQCDRLRDIFGNPFRPLPPRPEVIAPLAEQIYAGEWDKMPLLGEWLQEHGYWSEGEHCLDPNIHHVKGCWVVDWVTGRE
jgi:hypothetical protein